MKTRILILLCVFGSVFHSTVNAQSPTDPGEVLRKRIMEKVERVKAGIQKQVAAGRNPSAIVKTMQGTIKPLLDAGKPVEAEAELDRLLEQLGRDEKIRLADRLLATSLLSTK